MGKKMKFAPLIFNSKTHTKKQFKQFQETTEVIKIHDTYKFQLEELFEVENPNLLLSSEFKKKQKEFLNSKLNENNDAIQGTWIYYSWDKSLIHILDEKDFYKVKTNRNKNLINTKEQKMFSDYNVGIAGLSIGSVTARTIIQMGGSKKIKISDSDVYSLSNSNRVPIKLKEIGLSKIEATSRSLYEIDPFIHISQYSFGLNKKNVSDFFSKSWKLDVIIDAIDDFEMKVRLRKEAKKTKTAVVMLTNLADSILIDVERYDLEPNLPLFHGLISETVEEILHTPLTEEKKKQYAIDIVEKKHVPNKAIHSLKEIGSTLVGRPQLYSSVTTASGIASYLVRRLSIGSNLTSGRHYLSLADLVKENRIDD